MNKKKFAALFLVLILIVGLGAGAMAAPGDAGTITVNNVGKDTTLTLYKVLDYQYDATSGKYNTITFTLPAYKTEFINVITAWCADASKNTTGIATPDLSAATDTEVLLWVSNNVPSSATFGADLAAALETYIEDNAVAAVANAGTRTGNTHVFSGLDLGYYLIKDTAASVEGKPLYNAVVMLQPMHPGAVVTLKSNIDYSNLSKIIDDEEVSIGDIVNFTITSTIPQPENMNATSWQYVITDTMAAGFVSAQKDIIVKVNGTVRNPAIVYTDNTADPIKPETVITFTFDSTNFVIGDEIEITYPATVTAKAENENINIVVDTHGNSDEAKAYVFGIEILKHNELDERLEGVEFEVYKKGSTTPISFVKGSDNVYRAGTGAGASTTLTTNADGVIEVFGLAKGADGDYYLKEIKTLPGYNGLTTNKDILEVNFVENVNVIVVDENVKPAKDVTSIPAGLITVLNTTGIVLPGTGGMGTVLFPVLGGLILACAAFFLVINKKRIFGK